MEDNLKEYIRRAEVACRTRQIPPEQHLLAKILKDWASSIVAADRHDPLELLRLQGLCCGTHKCTDRWICTLKDDGSFHCPLGRDHPETGSET